MGLGVRVWIGAADILQTHEIQATAPRRRTVAEHQRLRAAAEGILRYETK